MMSAPTNVAFPSPRLNAGERLAVSGYTRGQVADYGNARAAERDEIHAAPAQAVVLEALRIAEEAKRCAELYASAVAGQQSTGLVLRKTLVDRGAALYGAIDRLAALVQPPEAPAARLVGGEAAGWTIIGPDGWTFSGKKPMNLILEASRHEREIDPAEADRQDMRLMTAIDEEMREHEADRAELVNRFLSWPLPASVGSDLCATDPLCGHARTGTNLLAGHEAAAMLAYVLDCDEGDRELAHRATQAAPTDALGEQPHAGSVAEAFWNGTLSERNKP